MSGVLSPFEIGKLWIVNGGNPADVVMAIAIALAESGGNPNATNHNTNGSIDRGIWQINSVHGAQSTLDPNANAKAAIAISNNGKNWGPWTTYASGAYKRYLAQAQSGAPKAVGGGGLGLPSIPNPLQPAIDVATEVGRVADLLTSADFWIRVAEGIAAMLLLILGLRALTGGEGNPIKLAAKHV